jgi:hypothetical protein
MAEREAGVLEFERQAEEMRRYNSIRRGMAAAESRNEIHIPKKKRDRIGGLQRGAMLVVAAFLDFLQLILTFLIIGLIINTILSFVIFLLFFGWFSANGVNFFSLKRPQRHLLVLMKLVPGVNAIPLWTFRIWSEIRLVRHEDREYNKRQAKVTAA